MDWKCEGQSTYQDTTKVSWYSTALDNFDSMHTIQCTLFRRKILCDAKPKPVSRKFQSKRSRLPQSTKGGGWVIYYAKSEVLDLESNLLFLRGGGNLLHTIGGGG